MSKFLTGTILALALATGPALAQTPAPTATPAAPAAKPAPAPAVQAPAPAAQAPAAPAVKASTPAAEPIDKAVEARFKGLDKSGNGFLDGAELTAFAPHLVKIDTDKDGKISLAEFAAAVKSGVIK